MSTIVDRVRLTLEIRNGERGGQRHIGITSILPPQQPATLTFAALRLPNTHCSQTSVGAALITTGTAGRAGRVVKHP